jgi:hypothetical protein
MVKALFPIGKTQWSKWNDEQKVAFNEAREAGVSFADAVEASNQMKKKGFNPLKVLEDVVEVAAAVSGATAAVDTTVKLVKTVTKKKGK